MSIYPRHLMVNSRDTPITLRVVSATQNFVSVLISLQIIVSVLGPLPLMW